VGYNVLEDLTFWKDGEFTSPKPSAEIRVINNPRFVADTVIGTTSGEQRATFDPLSNSIGQSGSSGDFHAHVDFRLEPLSDDADETPSTGAYGLKLSLISDNESIEESEPFYIVFQFGIEEDQFIQALDDFESLLLASSKLVGDFDADGVLLASDIDLLSAEVRAGSNTTSFDITNDQLVNELDRMKWVQELVGTSFGDADLDGNVQFADFLALAASFGTNGGWANGDFDGDARVQFSDFLLLSNNFGAGSVANVASVPEPSKSTVFGIVLALLVSCHRRRAARSIANLRERTRDGRSADSSSPKEVSVFP
jgi:hypothetical protein